MVKKNCPIPSTWIETDMDVNDRDFYKNIAKADEIVFFDDNGVSISHFFASKTTYYPNPTGKYTQTSKV